MSLIGKRIGNYIIKSLLGEGGMGTVYLGEHPLIGKKVAIKILLEELAAKPDIVSRFFNEAKAVNDVGHDNIVDIVDFGQTQSDSGLPLSYFVMEFLDGEPLATRLRKKGLSFQETFYVIAQCCSALSASHKKGIVHRDLKPDNIYLCHRAADENFVKVLDFGVAKLTGDPDRSNQTRSGMVLGTPAYMSPEQCDGKGNIDYRADIYSLGVVMYELVTGRVPFAGGGFGEVLMSHLTQQPERPSDINPEVTPEIEAIIEHAIEKNKDARFQTMEEFEAALSDPIGHASRYRSMPADANTTVSGYAHTPSGAHRAIDRFAHHVASGHGPPGGAGAGSRPSTLSAAASEVTNHPSYSSRSRSVRMAVGAAMGLIVAAMGVVWWQHRAPTATGVQLQSAPAATPPVIVEEFVVTSISTSPVGAEVTREGRSIGRSPLEIKVKKGSAPFDVLVHLDGFKPKTYSIQTDKSKELDMELEPEAPSVQVPAIGPTSVGAKSAPLPLRGKPKANRPLPHLQNEGQERGGDNMKILQPSF